MQPTLSQHQINEKRTPLPANTAAAGTATKDDEQGMRKDALGLCRQAMKRLWRRRTTIKEIPNYGETPLAGMPKAKNLEMQNRDAGLDSEDD